MSDDELVATVLLLVVAGHETTANTLTTGLYHLLRSPEAFAALREESTILAPPW
jgi:cytochrome P450